MTSKALPSFLVSPPLPSPQAALGMPTFFLFHIEGVKASPTSGSLLKLFPLLFPRGHSFPCHFWFLLVSAPTSFLRETFPDHTSTYSAVTHSIGCCPTSYFPQAELLGEPLTETACPGQAR